MKTATEDGGGCLGCGLKLVWTTEKGIYFTDRTFHFHDLHFPSPYLPPHPCLPKVISNLPRFLSSFIQNYLIFASFLLVILNCANPVLKSVPPHNSSTFLVIFSFSTVQIQHTSHLYTKHLSSQTLPDVSFNQSETRAQDASRTAQEKGDGDQEPRTRAIADAPASQY